MADVHCLLRHDFTIGKGLECYNFKPHVPLKGPNLIRVHFPSTLIQGIDVVRSLCGFDNAFETFQAFSELKHIKTFAESIEAFTKAPTLICKDTDACWIAPALLWPLISVVLPEFAALREAESVSSGIFDRSRWLAELGCFSRQLENAQDRIGQEILNAESRYAAMAATIKDTSQAVSNASEEVRSLLASHSELFRAELEIKKRELEIKACMDLCGLSERVLHFLSRNTQDETASATKEEVSLLIKKMLLGVLGSRPAEASMDDFQLDLDAIFQANLDEISKSENVS
eukprot:jgi/Mesvir1/25600/Mv01828-RA.1